MVTKFLQGITNIMGLDGVGDITSHHIVTASHDGSLAVWGSSGSYTSKAVTGAGVATITTAAAAAAATVGSKSSVKALVHTVQAHERGVKVCMFALIYMPVHASACFNTAV
jgi:hypothetical protein